MEAIPQYRQIADTIRRRIVDGVYREGELLPPAGELEESFGVSNITIRKALALLADEGLVEGKRGVGTAVRRAPKTARVAIAVSNDFLEWLETASGRRLPIEQEVIEIGTLLPVPRVAETLGVPPRTPLWRMRRLRRIDGAPVSYHINYGLPETLGRIDERRMRGNRNFVDLLREDLGLKLDSVEQRIEAAVADRDLARRLDVAFGDPVLFVEHIYRTVDGAVAAVSHLYLRGDRYAYRAQLRLGGETSRPA